MMDKKSGENFIVKKKGIKTLHLKKMNRIRKGSIDFFIEEEKKSVMEFMV
jgi:hypothetical protein